MLCVRQGNHQKPDREQQAANVQPQQPKGLEDAAQLPEKQRQVRTAASIVASQHLLVPWRKALSVQISFVWGALWAAGQVLRICCGGKRSAA